MGTPQNNFTVSVPIQNFRDAREHAQYGAVACPDLYRVPARFFFQIYNVIVYLQFIFIFEWNLKE